MKKIKVRDIIHSDDWWTEGDWAYMKNPVTGEILSSYIPDCMDIDEAEMNLKFSIIAQLDRMGLLAD